MKEFIRKIVLTDKHGNDCSAVEIGLVSTIHILGLPIWIAFGIFYLIGIGVKGVLK